MQSVKKMYLDSSQRQLKGKNIWQGREASIQPSRKKGSCSSSEQQIIQKPDSYDTDL